MGGGVGGISYLRFYIEGLCPSVSQNMGDYVGGGGRVCTTHCLVDGQTGPTFHFAFAKYLILCDVQSENVPSGCLTLHA